MKQEYLAAYEGVWYRIYEKGPSLKIDRMEQGRFHDFFTLSECFDADCSVAITSRYLHIVYKEQDGVCYALFDGTHWHKKILSFKGMVSGMHLQSSGDFVHLFYVSHQEDENMLVHQLLGEGAQNPVAVMSLSDDSFCVHQLDNGDVSVLLQNEEGVQGTLLYRWSKKDFDTFCPLDCGCLLKHPVLFAEENTILVAGFASFDSFVNLLYLEKNVEEDVCRLSAVHLAEDDSDKLCLSRKNGSVSLSWCENGMVMRAHMQAENRWSHPQKFVCGTGRENVLFRIENGKEHYRVFGYMKNGIPMFYSNEGLPELKKPQEDTCDSRGNQPEMSRQTSNAPSSAHGYSDKTNSGDDMFSGLYVKRSVYSADMAALRKVILTQNKQIASLAKRLEDKLG